MFDLINRYRAVFDVLKLDEVPNQSILDVGGSSASIIHFLKNKQNITVCDIVIEKKRNELNQIIGSGYNLPFKANSFDNVVCIDTLEHIPNDQRKIFVNELARVAKHKLVIATPHSEAYFFENLVLNMGKILRKEMKWLNEHKQFGLPEKEEISEHLKNYRFVVQKNCNIVIWFLQIITDFFTKPLQLLMSEKLMMHLYGPVSRYINFGKTYRIILVVEKS